MPIRLSGINSGLDTDAIVKELVSAYSLKTEKYEKQKTKRRQRQHYKQRKQKPKQKNPKNTSKNKVDNLIISYQHKKIKSRSDQSDKPDF